MNSRHRKRNILPITIILLAALLLGGGSLTRAGAGYSLAWWTVDGGGGSSSAGQLSLSGTVGQPDAGMLSGGAYELRGGFWTALTSLPEEGDPPEDTYTIALPLIVGGD
ncbi:MAG TPA: hypothetical protein VK879_17995 [Candidatus Sulfomarinibacteraceae bacterium]|nr:hypothetical protein [Candidatus Sulfomarinibacteraceae bacterium]